MSIDQNIRLVRLLTDLESLKSCGEEGCAEALQQALQRYLQSFLEIDVRCLPSTQDDLTAHLSSPLLSFPAQGVCVFELFSTQVILLKLKPDCLFSTNEIEEIKHMADLLMKISPSVLRQSQEFTIHQLKNNLLNEINIGFVVFDEQSELIEMNQLAQSFFQKEYPQLNQQEACATVMKKFSGSAHSTSPLTIGDFLLTRRSERYLDPFGYANTLYSIEIRPLRFKQSFQHQFQLSAREIEILDLLYQGLSNEEIVEKLFISTNTLRTHLKTIHKKVDVSNQKQLLYLYGTSLQS